jgi:hypothetical protein
VNFSGAASSEAIIETLAQFENKWSNAKASGETVIETTPEIIARFNPRGLGSAEYFIYKGIKVMPYGKTEEILNHENEQITKRLHGKEEGTIIS